MMAIPHHSVLTNTQAADHIDQINDDQACEQQRKQPIIPLDRSKDGTIDEPINREMPMTELTASWLTLENNYDRNHGPIQHLDASTHHVKVTGLVHRPLDLSIADLEAMPQHKVACSLLCAGNRRHSMRTRIKEVQGIDWFDGAVMNCLWEGPRLVDVLHQAGIKYSDSNTRDTKTTDKDDQTTTQQPQHVHFSCHATPVQNDEYYGGSIPLSRALDPSMDIILALRMNHAPLPARHGHPVRALIPGVLGARSIKWLDQITISRHESPNFYQRHDYKILPAAATDPAAAEPYWPTVPAMLDTPINSCIAHPQPDTTVHRDPTSHKLHVSGYAVPHGADGPTTHVSVSGDTGRSWTDAVLDPGPSEHRSKWTWTLWRVAIDIPPGANKVIWSRATDRGGNTQTEERSAWNLRGVGYNGFEAVWGLTVV